MPVILLWGHPHVIRHCRWWLVADAYAALAAKGPIRFPGSGLFLPRRTASAPLHCQPAALIAITSNMLKAHRNPAICSCYRTRKLPPNHHCFQLTHRSERRVPKRMNVS